jgi:hypothetical protein
MVRISKNTKIQIFYDRKYMAFDLFIYSANNVLKTLFNDVCFIDNFDKLEKNSTTVLIMYINDLGKYVKNFGFNVNNSIRIIFIHADFMFNHSKYDQNEIIKFVNEVNKNKCYIWDYSSQNIFYYNLHYKNIKYHFMPLLYNNYIEDFYNSRLKNGKIPWDKKDIDIVFLGDYSERRKVFFESIKTKYNTYIITNNDNYEDMVNILERSKIFVNIFSKETNKAFDYFRLALLYSNKVFTITETPKVNFKIEENLIELKDVLITCNYEIMQETIEKYINLPSEEINTVTINVYKTFRKCTLEKSILDFFEINYDLK